MAKKVNYKKAWMKALDSEMEFCGLKDTTKYQYTHIVMRYLGYTDDSPTFSRAEIMNFISSLGDTTSTYKSWVLTIIKRFHGILRNNYSDKISQWPLAPREGPKPKIKSQVSFTVDDVESILKCVDNERDYAIIRLLFVTGMRREEICNLKLSDYTKPRITFNMAKGEETRSVVLDDKTCSSLDAYLFDRTPESEYLFINNQGKKYSPSALSHVFKKYFSHLSIDGRVGFHAFRRGLVTLLHDKGMSETEIQKFFGWKTPEMVRRYVQLSPGRISDDVQRMHPFFDTEE